MKKNRILWYTGFTMMLFVLSFACSEGTKNSDGTAHGDCQVCPICPNGQNIDGTCKSCDNCQTCPTCPNGQNPDGSCKACTNCPTCPYGVNPDGSCKQYVLETAPEIMFVTLENTQHAVTDITNVSPQTFIGAGDRTLRIHLNKHVNHDMISNGTGKGIYMWSTTNIGNVRFPSIESFGWEDDTTYYITVSDFWWHDGGHPFTFSIVIGDEAVTIKIIQMWTE